MGGGGWTSGLGNRCRVGSGEEKCSGLGITMVLRMY